jgi:hypothetical protein
MDQIEWQAARLHITIVNVQAATAAHGQGGGRSRVMDGPLRLSIRRIDLLRQHAARRNPSIPSTPSGGTAGPGRHHHDAATASRRIGSTVSMNVANASAKRACSATPRRSSG